MKTITGEAPFQVNGTNFAVSPSASGYTLNYSADGKAYTAWAEATPAGEVLVVNGAVPQMYFKLAGNTDTVNVNL